MRSTRSSFSTHPVAETPRSHKRPFNFEIGSPRSSDFGIVTLSGPAAAAASRTIFSKLGSSGCPAYRISSVGDTTTAKGIPRPPSALIRAAGGMLGVATACNRQCGGHGVQYSLSIPHINVPGFQLESRHSFPTHGSESISKLTYRKHTVNNDPVITHNKHRQKTTLDHFSKKKPQKTTLDHC
eukprot:TRINITY_DN962_c2_g1_i2.p3 TRINITY_DN962_c2_g1~~TRINITY_DN962_c2_g1_i2.p3  ORF type:complete len:183 (+),score=15.37 TRINITY_DN962_c2_g1_i2:1043-1591(+)